MPIPSAYLDTCIVSGLAKGDLDHAEASALLRILEAHKAGRVHLVTSRVTSEEINAIPSEHRTRHEIIYNLLADLPQAATVRPDSGLTLMGVGGGPREDPLFTALKKLLPDSPDAEHTFQAARNQVEFLITVDKKTFLSHAAAVATLCGIRLTNPVAFEREVLVENGNG